MKYKECLKFLDKIEKFGIKLGLENIRKMLKKLGNPEKNIKFIHVAGTNGKGSVCAMLSSILTVAGYNVGLYTSPHLVEVTERFRINEKQISKPEFVGYFQKIMQVYKKETYFEFLTALALLYFYEKNVDVAILEVGMGGRFDATNIITPLVSVITSISLEHTQYLGDTLEKITSEKASIIKENVPCVTSNRGVALEIIREYCKESKSKLYLLDSFNILKKEDIVTNMVGEYQKINSKVAVKVIEILINTYQLKIVATSIKSGLLNVNWPGRLQIIGNIIYDCCHNPDAAIVLANEIKNLKIKYIVVLIGILNDKDYKSMVNNISGIVKFAIITKPNSDRALDPSYIKIEFDKYHIDSVIILNPRKALEYAKQLNEKILITGSMYLVGELIKYEWPKEAL